MGIGNGQRQGKTANLLTRDEARRIAIKMTKAAGAVKAADCLAAWRRQGESGRLWFGLVSIGARDVRLQPSQRQNSAS